MIKFKLEKYWKIFKTFSPVLQKITHEIRAISLTFQAVCGQICAANSPNRLDIDQNNSKTSAIGGRQNCCCSSKCALTVFNINSTASAGIKYFAHIFAQDFLQRQRYEDLKSAIA